MATGAIQEEDELRVATIRTDGMEQAAVIMPAGALPIAAIDDLPGPERPSDLFSLLENGKFYELQRWYDELGGGKEELADRAIPLDRVEYGPLYRHPRKIWGIGLNYVEHAGDLRETAPSGEPASFMKPDTAVVGPGEEIRLPGQSGRVTGEAELGLVIGREAKNVSEGEAASVVAGLTTVVDMTAEDILQRNPRYLTRAKSFDTFFSFGPHLVTPDEVKDVGALTVATVLNGKPTRVNSVSNMTFSPWFLVAFHSEVMTLLPGDVISTGTPGAVVIRDGDVVACHIEGFEPLANPVKNGA